jgi:hypothetical protein
VCHRYAVRTAHSQDGAAILQTPTESAAGGLRQPAMQRYGALPLSQPSRPAPAAAAAGRPSGCRQSRRPPGRAPHLQSRAARCRHDALAACGVVKSMHTWPASLNPAMHRLVSSPAVSPSTLIPSSTGTSAMLLRWCMAVSPLATGVKVTEHWPAMACHCKTAIHITSWMPPVQLVLMMLLRSESALRE